MEKSYFQILRASLISGGSGGFTMLLSLLRVKFAAIFLGPFGVGLLQGFNVVQGLMLSITSLGLQSSSVREIAKSIQDCDDLSLGKVILTIRRLCYLTGFSGFLITITFSSLISKLTFSTENYNFEIAALGLVVLVNNIVIADIALIQGARRIGDLARVNILVALFGTISAIIFYYVIGVKGLIPSLLTISIVQLIIARYYSKKIYQQKIIIPFFTSIYEGGKIVKLGLVITWTGLLVSTISYFTVFLVTNKYNIETVGYYSAAFALSGVFVNFVLSSMAADYLPRLVSVITDRSKASLIINQQSEIALLIATPGVLITFIFSPWILELAYSSDFKVAATLMQWFLLGCLGRVVSWPLGFAVLASGKIRWVLYSETIANIIHLTLLIVGVQLFGLNGVGYAFFLLYLFYTPIIYFVCRYLLNFTWTLNYLRLLFIVIATVVTIFIINISFDIFYSTLLNFIITLFICYYCINGVIKRIKQKSI
jgi:antigen flippase